MSIRRRWWTALAVLWVLAAATAGAAPLKPCELMKMLQSESQQTAQRGIDGLVRLGEAGAMPLVCFLAGKATGCPHPTNVGKLRGEAALARLGQAAIPAILDSLGAHDEELRTRLVRVLGRIKDTRREQPLLSMWRSEKSDRVRGALAGALMSFGDTSQTLTLLRGRVSVAGIRELQGLLVQFALKGTTGDLRQTLARTGGDKRRALLSAAEAELKQLGGTAAQAALRRLRGLK